ncbi:alpha/beta fold hydrolase [Nocardioides bizhenqiangii]|uniref:Alpha/beta hydrolase n=1 Tax=Nocardioides bizhenqiangii TaxID=3095076 RepID=A0ABZ0ZL43_9ACTN|nr:MULTISPECIES: alpha/beta hydrolase [unclassified Nocardioides]MDZ5620626.1 alpha/beta hydrolase [Nocardioides sp. HM23]WQQ24995.1 alpha/beta hydrolase [Nocardioides sp. HM61]
MATPVRPAVSVIISAVLLGGGCAEDHGDDPPQPSSSEFQTSDVPPDAVVETEDTIAIDERSLYLKCWGEPVPGEPTVLLLSGQGPPVSYWEPMAPDLATEGHHLCGYDRAGVGRSEAPPEDRRTTDDQVADLVAMLDAADLNEPLVVVAHSLGSLPAIALADRAPQRVAGVVFVDPWAPRVSSTLLAALPPEKPHESAALMEERRFLTDFLNDPAQNSERLLLAACDEQAAALLDQPGPIFGDRPVLVLQAPFPPRPVGLPRDYDEVARAAWTNGNKELAAESTRGEVIEVENTGHDIHADRPEVVMDAIRDVIAG